MSPNHPTEYSLPGLPRNRQEPASSASRVPEHQHFDITHACPVLWSTTKHLLVRCLSILGGSGQRAPRPVVPFSAHFDAMSTPVIRPNVSEDNNGVPRAEESLSAMKTVTKLRAQVVHEPLGQPEGRRL